MVGNATRSRIETATRIVNASVFVLRYPPQMTEEEVKTDLMLDPRVKDLDIHVEAVKTKYDIYSSFHVTCVCKEIEAKLFLGTDLWPRGILYRQWKEKRKFPGQGTGGYNMQDNRGGANNYGFGRGGYNGSNGNGGQTGNRRFYGYGGGVFNGFDGDGAD